MSPFPERTFTVDGRAYRRTDVGVPAPVWRRLPYVLRVLAEGAVRTAARRGGSPEAVDTILERRVGAPVSLFPARLLLQDLLAVPLLVDLAALRDAVAEAGGDPSAVDARLPVDLVIDHSLRVDAWARADAGAVNLRLEHERNVERFGFLRWCEQAFDNLRVVPPGKGIMHQINVERLARIVWTDDRGPGPALAFPDTVLGTDSHTPMVNGVGVLGWGLGGIEAQAVLLGHPFTFALPRVVGVEVHGRLPDTATPTDLALTVTELLRQVGVIGSFVEFFGPGLDTLGVPDRATIANMAPEQGATCSFFPVDRHTIKFLRATGRAPEQVALAEGYARELGLWREPGADTPDYDEVVRLDLARVGPSIAGPRRPEDRIDLADAARAFGRHLAGETGRAAPATASVYGGSYRLRDGAVIIAAIASCTNTSNPRAMATAGLLARNAVRRGLSTKPWVKTSLTPGSQVIASMLAGSGLQADLDQLGFQVAGFGCATCNGMSGPIDPVLSAAITDSELVAVAVVSGNRNFAGRIHPDVRAAYLAAPALVVAYALTGSITADLTAEPLGADRDGVPVHLRDLWPAPEEVSAVVEQALRPAMFDHDYADLFDGGERWRATTEPRQLRFPWDPDSTYIRRPPYFQDLPLVPPPLTDVRGARPLVILGDSVTTDDISPSGTILAQSAAGQYLRDRAVTPANFNSYGTRRGNHEVGMRSTFANRRLRNAIVPGVEGSVTRVFPEGRTASVFDAAREYAGRGVPLVVLAGRDYGCGSSRDWAAKGPALLGVRAVIAGGFERIHRANLVGMGILPLQFPDGVDARSLGLTGSETFDLLLPASIVPGATVECVVRRADETHTTVPLRCRADTPEEVDRLRHGGILPAVWRELVKAGEEAA
ncbi:aconitate hydratase AcnA [Dactylosporangium roseum]|uniref:Aconitate hydratase n=1 Tax=Dactylosporangium roseum TaxID=47989 RepID=A0ABY5YX96_9ACTN|nr:aconitate hydratase AcnA [Dactylosporangium roseum]UWZ34376.1 aconitate hydratase AcnA [Dactylosporangium roseum]